jgi:RNA polymerase sigma factor (sigma-70 family)
VTDRLDDPVWDEVRALPGKQRLAVSLRYQGDLSHRQIAEAMGISEAAARRNVFEGLKNLRERIGDE